MECQPNRVNIPVRPVTPVAGAQRARQSVPQVSASVRRASRTTTWMRLKTALAVQVTLFVLLSAIDCGLLAPLVYGSDLGCAGLWHADTTLTGPGGLRFVRAGAPPSAPPRMAAGQHVRAGYENLNLGSGTYGSVEFVAFAGGAVGPPYPLVNQSELLVFSHVQDAGRDEWWELVTESDGEVGHLVVSGDHPPVSFRLATGEPTLPLFVFSYPQSEQAMYSATTISQQVVIDFRNHARRVLACLTCSVSEGVGGNCSPYDSDYYDRTELSCDWDAGTKDFLCTEIDVLPIGWGQRRATRRFLLGRELLPTPDSGSLRPSRHGVLGELEIPGVGPLQAVFTGFLNQNAGAYTIYVAQGTSPVFDARFFAVALWPDREQFLEIVPRQLDIGGELFDDSPLRGEPADPAPATSVRLLPTADTTLHLFQIVATDQGMRGLYVVGVEETPRELKADAFLLATEAAYYSRCREYIVPENAIAVDYRQAPFGATVWLEPSFRVEAFRGDLGSIRTGNTYQLVSPVEASLCWQKGSGFLVTRDTRRQPDPRQPVFVAISGDGQIAGIQAVR